MAKFKIGDRVEVYEKGRKVREGFVKSHHERPEWHWVQSGNRLQLVHDDELRRIG